MEALNAQVKALENQKNLFEQFSLFNGKQPPGMQDVGDILDSIPNSDFTKILDAADTFTPESPN